MLFSKQDFLNTKWFIAEKLIQLLVGIFIIPKIFNSLGVLNIGKLKFAETFIAFFAPVLFLGLSAICIRQCLFNNFAWKRLGLAKVKDASLSPHNKKA